MPIETIATVAITNSPTPKPALPPPAVGAGSVVVGCTSEKKSNYIVQCSN